MVSQSRDDDPAAPCALFSPLLEEAARLAARGHYHQFRKGSPGGDCCSDGLDRLPDGCVPYVTHLMGSMCILARLGAPDEVLAAVLLHDYLEDVPDGDGEETIRRAAGQRVLDLVLAVTEDKIPELDESDTWELRKREQIDRIREMPADAVLIKAADVLHNVESLRTDLPAADHPHLVWRRLNAGPERQLWYFEAVLEAVSERLDRHPLVTELARAIAGLRRLMAH
jgi:hypothetical protein